ncbi:LPXTG cell wall anchor domain-containing protein, partial [Enterococcus faecalis]|nr:LPXTG cell wall anchor domain-containing protein [Enterococcus faecalis]
VTADFSNIDFSKVGTYDVVLTAADNQTKTVTLTIKEKVTDTTDTTTGSSAGKNINGSGITSKSSPTTGSTINKSSFPSTGEITSPLLTVIGAITLLTGGVYVLTLNHKKSK